MSPPLSGTAAHCADRQIQASDKFRARRGHATPPHNLFELLRSRVEATPDRLQYRFIRPSGDVDEFTCAALWRVSSTVAAQLLAVGLSGQRVILACDSQEHLVISICACLLADVIAVPAPLPACHGSASRTRLLAAHADAGLMVVDSDASLSVSRSLDCPVLDLRVALSASAAQFDPQYWPKPRVTCLSEIYHRSGPGATSAHEAVLVYHSEVLAHCADIAAALSIDQHSRVLMSLPLLGEACFMGDMFAPLHSGCEGSFIEPDMAVASAHLWLEAIDRYGITHTGGPGALFERAAEVPLECGARLDLSRWRVAWCETTAEPTTLDRFRDRFAPQGFCASWRCVGHDLSDCSHWVADDTEAVASGHQPPQARVTRAHYPLPVSAAV